MAEKIIMLGDDRAPAPQVPAVLEPATGLLGDTLGRPLHDLRISVTDRCNFRCTYCMPREVFDADYKFLPHSSLLSFEEITRAAQLFVAHGVEKLRLTGGEPLVRRDMIELVRALGRKLGDGLDELTLTTNGTRLAEFAEDLFGAGVRRINVSLDTLDRDRFTALARRDGLRSARGPSTGRSTAAPPARSIRVRAAPSSKAKARSGPAADRPGGRC